MTSSPPTRYESIEALLKLSEARRQNTRLSQLIAEELLSLYDPCRESAGPFSYAICRDLKMVRRASETEVITEREIRGFVAGYLATSNAQAAQIVPFGAN